MTARAAAATSTATRDFAGFRPAAVSFLRALGRHNDREWFERHRTTYEREVRSPLAALVEEMDVRLASAAPEIVGDPKRSPFRIHRDVRFSSDKSPYKTHAACWFHHADAGRGVGRATTAHGGAGFYLDIGPTTSSIGGGIWMPPRPTLARIRERIDEEGASLARVLGAPSLRRYGGLAQDSMLARMPRGYAASHPAAALLRHQSFTVGRTLTARELFSPRLPDLLARDYVRILPLVRWLNGALGLRTLARR
ncbi:MAG TPA: DUF2461 domain-containing protein [Gemmatimonadaceae bacterium]|nr:DUF2461 domain-containing protein [Gemmatimonadaceae bacterium]